MSHHVLSVCIFCFICATHSPCASHAAVIHENAKLEISNLANGVPPVLQSASREKFKPDDLMPADQQDDSNKPHKISEKLQQDSGFINSEQQNNLIQNKDLFIKEIFQKFGDGDTISVEGFDKLLTHLGHLRVLSAKLESHESGLSEARSAKDVTSEISSSSSSSNNLTCTLNDSLHAFLESTRNSSLNFTRDIFEVTCPAILLSIISSSEDCLLTAAAAAEDSSSHHGHSHDDLLPSQHHHSNPHVWLYSITAVIVISACGGFSLLIIPVMQKKFYKPMLQFLVALAVGTLAGDALLHLLPHAMMGSHAQHSEGHHGLQLSKSGHEAPHDNDNMWKGFVAMLGLILFFMMERFIPLMYKWRKSKRSKIHSHVKVLNTELEVNKNKNTQCMDRYNPYPRCYKDIVDDPTTTFADAEESLKKDGAFEKAKGFLNQQTARRKSDNAAIERLRHKNMSHNLDRQDEIVRLNSSKGAGDSNLLVETNQNMTECPGDLNLSNCTEENKMLPHIEVDEIGDIYRQGGDGITVPNPPPPPAATDYTVILREHNTAHHGHSHSHGHVHAAPQNLSSVAWMVIMGDGLHNFTDGMAIGAAFSSSLAGGFSTAVAVFCHELPHELGDFAMLLKAGMSIQKALFYNVFSSVLCIVGNVVGIWLGNTESASSWVFAIAAGTFIYIALVDMIPELSSAHEDEGNFVQSLLHLGGLLTGFGIMTLIALYEHDLKNIFKE